MSGRQRGGSPGTPARRRRSGAAATGIPAIPAPVGPAFGASGPAHGGGGRGRTALVVGATGRLGPRLCGALAGDGWRVVTAARHRAELVGDASDPAQAERMVLTARPAVVVILAALADVDACERDHAAAFRNNALLPSELSAAARRAGAACIHFSTDQVYDGPGPHAEADIRLVNHYAVTKRAGEEQALANGAVVLRTNFLGRSGDPARRGFSDWLVGGLGAGQPITLCTDVRFTPLFAGTLVGLVARIAAGPVPGLYNCGSRGGVTKAEAARHLARRLGLSLATAREGRQADLSLDARRPDDMRMDCRRFASAYQVELPSTADELDRTADDHRAAVGCHP